MIDEREIPVRVLQFVEANIDDVPQLETLLMMHQSPARQWRVAEVASRNYISEPRAEQALHALRQRGLIVAESEPPQFRFGPATEEARALVADLDRCYRTNLSRITTFIHSKPSASVKEFARAFDFKKDR